MVTKFGKAIRRRRCLVGYNLVELSKAIGISESYLSLIERGERPPPVNAKLTLLADVLGIDRDDMFYLAGRLPPDAQILAQRDLEAVTKFVRNTLK